MRLQDTISVEVPANFAPLSAWLRHDGHLQTGVRNSSSRSTTLLKVTMQWTRAAFGYGQDRTTSFNLKNYAAAAPS
jgi:hypothetical protein